MYYTCIKLESDLTYKLKEYSKCNFLTDISILCLVQILYNVKSKHMFILV